MQVNIYSILPLLSSLLALFLAIFVYVKQIRSPINRAFSRFSFLTFIWLCSFGISFSLSAESEAFFWLKIGLTAVILMPVSFFHFTYAFLDFKSPKPVLSFLYVISLLFIFSLHGTDYFVNGLYTYSWGHYPKAGVLYLSYLILLFLTVGACDLLLFLKWLKLRKESSVYKYRLQFILLAFIICTFVCVDFIPNYGIDIYPLGWIFVNAYCAIIAYAIVRYRVLDVRLIFKRTMAYSLAAGLLMGLFVVLVLTVTNFLSAFTDIGSFKISVIAAVVIALMFNPLRVKIQGIIDKLFYKRTYDYYATIGRVSQQLESMFDEEKIYSFVGENIYSTLGLKNIHVLIAGTTKESYETVYYLSKQGRNRKGISSDNKEEGAFSGHSEIIKFLNRSKGIIIKDELSDTRMNLRGEIIDRLKAEFNEMDGEAAVPVFVDQRMEILFVLGAKMSADMFSQEDVNLLNTIANQTAIALKNARLYKEKVDSERLASVGMMSATFAHEVRNPLTSLKTFAQLMPEKYNDPEFRNTFSKIVEGEIEKIDGLIGDLLDFSSEKKSSRINEFDLAEILDETIDYVKGKLAIEQKNIIFKREYVRSEYKIFGDAHRLNQAFVNIIANGCQAMNGDGVLKVSMRLNGGSVEVAITDTGEGIDSDDIAKIFDPFVTTKEMGIGLGLAISKRIIEDHEGSINVDSKVSIGSTFTITLPVQNE